MILGRDERSSIALFGFATFLIVAWIKTRIEDPLAFFFCAGGVMLFSFSLRRAIKKFVDEA